MARVFFTSPSLSCFTPTSSSPPSTPDSVWYTPTARPLASLAVAVSVTWLRERVCTVGVT